MFITPSKAACYAMSSEQRTRFVLFGAPLASLVPSCFFILILLCGDYYYLSLDTKSEWNCVVGVAKTLNIVLQCKLSFYLKKKKKNKKKIKKKKKKKMINHQT
jgi:hypothetical protein